MSAETIRAWFNHDQIDASAPVWTDGMPAYAPLRDVPALFRVISEDAARGDSIARITHPSTTVATEAAAAANGNPRRSTTSTARLVSDVRSGFRGPFRRLGRVHPAVVPRRPSRGSTLAARFERLARLEDVDDADVNVGVVATTFPGSNPSSRPPAMGQISSMCDALHRELRALERERDEHRARIEEEREAGRLIARRRMRRRRRNYARRETRFAR